MKKIIIIPLLICSTLLFCQDYTWDKYATNYAGGHQSVILYSSTTSPNWFFSGSLSNDNYEGYSGFLTPKLDVRPPRIDSIIDIPNDQGRWVQIIWDKCGYDAFYSQDNFYSIWRQDEDLTGKEIGLSSSFDINEVLDNVAKNPKDDWFWLTDGSIWTFIDQVPALVYEQYSYDAPTLKDSIAPDNSYFSSFKVVFHDLYKYYESQPDSGYSVDNIAPFAPVLDGSFHLNYISLQWDENKAEDFQYFAVYRSNDPENFPEIPFETTSDTLLNDNDISSDQLYYKVTAFDFNGNESEASNTIVIETTLRFELKVFLEGPFQGTLMSTQMNALGLIPDSQPFNHAPWFYNGIESGPVPGTDIVDWVLIELRDAATPEMAGPSTMIKRKAAYIKNDGTIVNLNGISPVSISAEIDQNLFVVIYHRNHLDIMSSSDMELTDGLLTYDFTTDETTVYGGLSGHKQLSLETWGMISGDANNDGIINLNDKIDIWNIETGTIGYLPGDFNLDGQINNLDKNDFWWINISQETQVPD
ncbi:MAG: hypothetical protein KQI35_01265 [Bacteroidetes bacterium]|nr:hypothetical protein [Bacteroidota bacterium]